MTTQVRVTTRDRAVTLARVVSRPVAALCLLVLVVQVALMVWLARSSAIGQPNDVPVGIVTAPLVGKVLADEANALPDGSFEAYVLAAPEARSEVRDGSLVAAIHVELSGTRDTVLLNRANDSALNEAVLQRIRALERSRGRSVEVEFVDTSHGSPGTADRLVLAANALGFMFVVIVSMTLGPVTRTLRRGLLRHAALAGVAVLGAGIMVWLPGIGLGRFDLRAVLIVALAVWVTGGVTLALEALAGLPGLALAVVLFLLEAIPLLIGTDARLFPEPWPTLVPLLPLGAMRDALAGVVIFDGSGLQARPMLTLGAWLVIVWIVALTARWVRRQFGIDPGDMAAGTSRRTRIRWRLRVATVVVPSGLLLVGMPLSLPRTTIADVAEIPSRASETECVPTGEVEDLADLNRVAGRLSASDTFQGGDVGASVRLQDGRRLFFFGDTLRAADRGGQRFVRNSMLVLGSGCLQMVEPVDHGAIIPDRDAEVGYWPMSVGLEERPGYDLVAISAQRVRTSGTGSFDFENLGPAIAVFVVPRGGTPQLVDRRDIGPDDADASHPTWGAAVAVDDGWAYLYGTAHPDEDMVFGFSLSVARVRPDDILDRSRWRFWDGKAWVRSQIAAQELIPARGGVSQTLSVFEQDGTWYALSKRDEFLGTDLTVWTASSPTGPFTAHGALAQMPSDTVKGDLRYMPLAHPGLLPQDGTMVVSYSRNRTDLAAVVENPLLYRPRFLRVDLPD